MTDMNTVLVIGRIVKDVEIKYTSSGMAIINGSLAVNRSIKKAGAYVEEASFFDFQMFGQLAENLKPYLLKGKRICASGYLKQDRWQDQQGVTHSKTFIGVQLIQLLDSGSTKGNPPKSAVSVSDGSGSAADFNDIPF